MTFNFYPRLGPVGTNLKAKKFTATFVLSVFNCIAAIEKVSNLGVFLEKNILALTKMENRLQ